MQCGTLTPSVLVSDGPDGLGRIGVQMAANAEVLHTTSKGPLETVQMAGKQFAKLTKTVVFGKLFCIANVHHPLSTCMVSLTQKAL